MARVKITNMAELTSVATGDKVPIVDVSTGETKFATISNLRSNVDTITELTDVTITSIAAKPI